MFENLFGNIEERQEKLREKLLNIHLESSVMDRTIVVKANALRVIQDITLDREKIDLNDIEQLQDLLVTAINDVISMAAEAEATESQKLIDDILPGGLGGLFGK